jgi:hypothetical protein
MGDHGHTVADEDSWHRLDGLGLDFLGAEFSSPLLLALVCGVGLLRRVYIGCFSGVFRVFGGFF